MSGKAHHPSSSYADYGAIPNLPEEKEGTSSGVTKKGKSRRSRKNKTEFDEGLFESVVSIPKGRRNKGNCKKETGAQNCKSILKKHSNKNLKVSFADEVVGDKDFVHVREFPSGYWKGVKPHHLNDILKEYQVACQYKDNAMINTIFRQLLMIKNNVNYSAVLNLYGICVTREILDSLEAIFKMVTFHSIYIYVNNLCKTSVIDLFEMISFYDPVKEMVVCDSPTCFDYFIWDVVSNTIKECYYMSGLGVRQINMDDQALATLFNIVNAKNNIKTLRFDGCEVGTASEFNIACYLDENMFLEEIRLSYANLCHKEAEILGKYIAKNNVLKTLDLSNNKLGDRGIDALARGLCEQAYRGVGIETLILVGNRITRGCAITLCNILANCPLKVIDLGYNNLSDVVLIAIKDDIADSKTLTAIGLQATFISCAGLFCLTDACVRNKHLKYLNLRGNKQIKQDSINRLARTVRGTSLVNVELDDGSRSNTVSRQYIVAVNELHTIVKANKLALEGPAAEPRLTDYLDEGYRPDLSYYVLGPRNQPTSSGRFKVVSVKESVALGSSVAHSSLVNRDLNNAVSVTVNHQLSRYKTKETPNSRSREGFPNKTGVQREILAKTNGKW